ncbi:hypothetical protein SLE2022_314150 [Rubroshorea leprosula]
MMQKNAHPSHGNFQKSQKEQNDKALLTQNNTQIMKSPALFGGKEQRSIKVEKRGERNYPEAETACWSKNKVKIQKRMEKGETGGDRFAGRAVDGDGEERAMKGRKSGIMEKSKGKH